MLFLVIKRICPDKWFKAKNERDVVMATQFRLLLSGCLVLSAGTYVLSQPQGLGSAEALRRYRESLSYSQSVSMKILQVVDSNDNELFPQTFDFVFRQDSETSRAEWIGKMLIFGSDGNIDLDNSTFIRDVADRTMLVSVHSMGFTDGPDGRRALLWYDYSERLRTLLENPNYAGPLFGRMYGSDYRSVPDLLAEAGDLQIHHEKENINGAACYVLEGTSRYGKVTAWVAPEKGYSAMKWVIEKDPWHLFDDTAISRKWADIRAWKVVFDLKELHEIEGDETKLFVPKRAHFTHVISFRDGTKNVDHFEYETSDIQVNPDFEALGAFKIDLPEGIRVFSQEMPDLKFRWQNGKLVAHVDQSLLDTLDKQIEQLKGEVKTESVNTTIEKTQVAPNQPTGLLDTKPGTTTDAAYPQRNLAAESAPSHAWVLILIALIIFAALLWLLLHRLKA